MSERTAFWAAIEKRCALKDSEAAGEVADSMEVRRSLMARVHSGEITLEEAQRQLKKIQRNASQRGLLTREQAYNQG